jgi:hypothetical protein
MHKWARVLLVLLVLSLGSMTLAQSQPSIQCGSLSAADCTLLTDSVTAMQTLKSATFDLNLQLEAKNIPNSPDMTVGLTGNGSFAADLMAIKDSFAQAIDPQTAVNALASAIKGFNGDLNLNLTLPAEAMSALGPGAGTGPINLQLRLVDGVGYINFDPLDALAGGKLSQAGLKGWTGLDLAGALTQFYPMMQSMLPDMSSITGMMGSGSSDSTAAMGMMDLSVLAKFFTVTRQPDANGSAVFVTNLDIAGLIDDPDFQKAIFDIAKTQDSTLTEDQVKAELSAFAASGATFTVTVTQAVDLSSGYLRSEELAFNANMDMAQMAGSASTGSGLSQLTFDASISFDNINSAPAITAPEGATVIPLASLLGGMTGMGGN